MCVARHEVGAREPDHWERVNSANTTQAFSPRPLACTLHGASCRARFQPLWQRLKSTSAFGITRSISCDEKGFAADVPEPSAAEIRLLNVGVGEQAAGLVLEAHVSGFENVAAAGDRECHVRVLLDQQHRDSLLVDG